MKILLVGNGINLAFSNKAKEYSKVLDKAQLIGYELAKKEGMLKSASFYGEMSIDNYKFEDSALVSNADQFTQKAWNYLNDHAQDSEITWSLIFMSDYFAKSRNQKKFISDNKGLINDEVKKHFEENDLTETELEPKDFIEQKLSEYDYIVTTNYDNNIEQYTNTEIIHIHGDISKNSNIKIGPFAEKQSILDAISRINFDDNDIELDIFGISMITEPHIIKFLIEHAPKRVNHYIHEFKFRKNAEDIVGLSKKYVYGDSEIDLMHHLINGDDIATSIDLFNKNYNKLDSHEWLDTKGDEEVNTTFVLKW